jgi:outer membrane protein assembly factor BamB
MQIARGENLRPLSLSAFNSRTGKREWTVSGGRSEIVPGDGPAISGGTVFYASRNGTLFALRAATGKQLWHAKFAGVVLEPVVANGVVYTGVNGRLYALNARTGRRLWSTTLDSWIAAYPVISRGALYVSSGAGTLFRFDLGGG